MVADKIGNTAIGTSNGITGLLNGITMWFTSLSIFELILLLLVFGLIIFIIWGTRTKSRLTNERQNRLLNR